MKPRSGLVIIVLGISGCLDSSPTVHSNPTVNAQKITQKMNYGKSEETGNTILPDDCSHSQISRCEIPKAYSQGQDSYIIHQQKSLDANIPSPIKEVQGYDNQFDMHRSSACYNTDNGKPRW